MDYPEKLVPMEDDNTGTLDHLGSLQDLDGNLATAWQVMRRLCFLVNMNQGAQPVRLIQTQLIHETMAAVIYRLLPMPFAPGSINESIRLGLLVFSYHVFLQWQDIKLPHHCLATKYRKCIQGVTVTDEISSRLILWLLMVGTNAFYNISDEVWLRELLKECAGRCRVNAWKEFRELLKSFLWISFLDDQSGKAVYESLFPCDGKS